VAVDSDLAVHVNPVELDEHPPGSPLMKIHPASNESRTRGDSAAAENPALIPNRQAGRIKYRRRFFSA
jgi:hypothetical protein